MKRYLEAGRLNSPRGLKGELRFECWCDDAEFLSGVSRLYLDPDGKRFLEVERYIPHLGTVVFKGYPDRTSASALTGRTLWFDREDVTLPEGTWDIRINGEDAGDSSLGTAEGTVEVTPISAMVLVQEGESPKPTEPGQVEPMPVGVNPMPILAAVIAAAAVIVLVLLKKKK